MRVAIRVRCLLREHLLDFLVAQTDLVYGVSLSLEGLEVAFDVGRKKDFYGYLWLVKELRRMTG